MEENEDSPSNTPLDATKNLQNAQQPQLVQADLEAMVEALKSGKLSFAGVDTFENEPTPAVQVLMTPNVSLTPHIGAATTQAQERIGSELASQIISILK